LQSKIDNGDYNDTLAAYSFLCHVAEGIARVNNGTRTAEVIGGSSGGNGSAGVYYVSSTQEYNAAVSGATEETVTIVLTNDIYFGYGNGMSGINNAIRTLNIFGNRLCTNYTDIQFCRLFESAELPPLTVNCLSPIYTTNGLHFTAANATVNLLSAHCAGAYFNGVGTGENTHSPCVWNIQYLKLIYDNNEIVTGESQTVHRIDWYFQTKVNSDVSIETSGLELFPYLMCTSSYQTMENMNAVGRVFAMMFTPALSKSVSKLQYIIAQGAPSYFEFALYRYTGAFANGNIPVEFLAKTIPVSNASAGLVEATFENAVRLSAAEVYYLIARTSQGDQMPRLRAASLNLLQDNDAPAALRGQNVGNIASFTSLSGLERLSGTRIVPYVKLY
jgi:hypothetical protein